MRLELHRFWQDVHQERLKMEESRENEQFSALIRLGLYKLGLILVVCPSCHLVQIVSKKQLREQKCPYCGEVKRKEV